MKSWTWKEAGVWKYTKWMKEEGYAPELCYIDATPDSDLETGLSTIEGFSDFLEENPDATPADICELLNAGLCDDELGYFTSEQEALDFYEHIKKKKDYEYYGD